MSDQMQRQVFDLLERLFWTLVQAAIGFLAAVQTDNIYIGLACAGGASALKSFAATKFGNGTASTLPAVVEPEYTPNIAEIDGPVEIEEEVFYNTEDDESYPDDIETSEVPSEGDDFDPDFTKEG